MREEDRKVILATAALPEAAEQTILWAMAGRTPGDKALR